MEQKKKYVTLQNLEVYQLARELSRIGWKIYEPLDWQTKKIMGDQFIIHSQEYPPACGQDELRCVNNNPVKCGSAAPASRDLTGSITAYRTACGAVIDFCNGLSGGECCRRIW